MQNVMLRAEAYKAANENVRHIHFQFIQIGTFHNTMALAQNMCDRLMELLQFHRTKYGLLWPLFN